MSRQVRYAPWFDVDVHYYLAWYAERAGADLAERLVTALDVTVSQLSSRPELGRRPFPRDTDLVDVHSALLRKVLQRFKHRLVFDGRGDDVVASGHLGVLTQTEDRQIVALGGAAGEDHLLALLARHGLNIMGVE